MKKDRVIIEHTHKWQLTRIKGNCVRIRCRIGEDLVGVTK